MGLAEKIKVVEKTEEEEIGNYTCVLRHLHFLDHNNDLDLRAMINTIDNHQNANKWLKEQQIQNYQTCYQMAENMPRHEQPFVEEGKPNMAKHQLFSVLVEAELRDLYAPRPQDPDRAQF